MEQINRDALFCDETEDYRCPSEADAGEVVTFYFRTEKNGADAVVLLECDPETGALLQEWQMKRLSWECCAGSVGNGTDTNRGIDGSGMADKSDSRFDYYSCALTLGTKTFSYVFQVTWGENVCLYNRIGRDTHLCIEGAAVTSLAVRFVLDWNYAAKENLFLEDSLFEIPQYTRNGRDPVQIISSGPDSKTKMIHDNYLRLIHRAQDHVYIQTPYFIPDDSILDALKIAAKSGVDVRIMIPCKPDHPFVYWATYSYIGEMVAAGAKCYVYNNGFLHAKTLSIDGMVACVGTANMDFRSFGLNFEVNAVIYSERTVQRLERAFENDMTLCTQVTRKVYDERGLVIKAKEQFSRLLSPLL